MNPVNLSITDARKIIVNAAGLARPAQFGTGTEAVYSVINHFGFVQIDTNYVVERAHHHVLAARIPGYQKAWLDELVEGGRIFEFFTSDASYIPMDDFRFSLPVKEAFATGRKPLTRPEINLMGQILDRIEREGPLMVKDFENDRVEASAGWWDWRPAKLALERLYFDGKLMITRTKGFQKVYDMPLNLLPQELDTSMPSPQEFARYVIRRTLGSLGIAYVKDIAWRARRVKGNLVKQELEKMVAEGEVCNAIIKDLKTAPLYMLASYKDRQIKLSGDAFILSPFDVLNIFRHRLRDFFNFDYQVECFVPAAKRKYGYFSLPILVGDTFVARMDAKAERKQKILIVHNLHFEPLEINEQMILKIRQALQQFALFNQCHHIVINKCNLQEYNILGEQND